MGVISRTIVESRATGAAGDLKHVMFRGKPEPGEKAVIFINQPAVLADIHAKSFLSDDVENVLCEVAVRAVKEIDVFRDVNPSALGKLEGQTQEAEEHEQVLDNQYET